VERFNLKKLSGMDVRKQYQIEISNRFEALNYLNDRENINRDWKNIKENTNISDKETLILYEQKQQKPWFDEGCSQFLGQREQVKMQWLQDSNQSNLDNLNNTRREASKHFRGKQKEYMEAKIN
jgi:hypothetical protein